MPFTRKIFLEFTFVLIFVLAAFLYFYRLGEVPNGLYVDEASQGYNAYSILKTGKDEYGKSFPVLFRFLAVYAPPLYTYLTTLPVAFFGLSAFSVRALAALSAVTSSLVVYFFLKNSGFLKEKLTPFLSSVLFLISPWLVLHGRYGYEVTTAFLIFSLGTLLLWRGLRDTKFIILGFGLLSLSTYASYSQRFLAPLLIISYLLFFRRKLLRRGNFKHLSLGLIIALILQIAHLAIITEPAFFVKSGLLNKALVLSQSQKVSKFMPHGLAIVLSFAREFLAQFFSYFSPRSLFFLPDPDLQRSIPELSVFYFWMVIPYFVGIYFLWRERRRKFSKFILLLAFLSPIPAALTRDPFSTYRAFPLLLPLTMVIGIGVDRIIQRLSARVWIPVFGFLFAFSAVLLWRSYFVFLPNERAKVWGYGLEILADKIKENSNEMFVIDQTRMKPAYIELAFFLKYQPDKFQKEVHKEVKDSYYKNLDFNANVSFANIETRAIDWEKDVYKKQILVGDELSISEGQAKEHFLTEVFEIKDPIDQVIFRGYRTNPLQKCATTGYRSIYCRNIN